MYLTPPRSRAFTNSSDAFMIRSRRVAGRYKCARRNRDRLHLVIDTIDRLPQTGDKGVCLKQQLQDKLIEHKQYINEHGEDMPEIRNWKWEPPHE